MNTITGLISTLFLALLLSACGAEQQDTSIAMESHDEHEEERGPNNGRLFHDGDFTIELALIEGAEPRYRAWASQDGAAIAPESVTLQATLTRLDRIDEFSFDPQNAYLTSNAVITEPHSFSVQVNARYAGASHSWEFDSFEGRTNIDPVAARALNIETEIAGPQTLALNTSAYGRVLADTERLSHVSARFEGRIATVHASIGETVSAGSLLATVESNQSLTSYEITAPISGIVLARDAGPGEQTGSRTLFTIMDNSSVWVDLAIFPKDLASIKTGASVKINTPYSDTEFTGTIARFLPHIEANQAVTARVQLNNPEGELLPGAWVEASINVADVEVPLAVRREALQSFRDFTVVYAQYDNDYEVRMLELGRQSDEWVEVLSGLTPGTTYVTQNSYVLKADVEKDGATHDH